MGYQQKQLEEQAMHRQFQLQKERCEAEQKYAQDMQMLQNQQHHLAKQTSIFTAPGMDQTSTTMGSYAAPPAVPAPQGSYVPPPVATQAPHGSYAAPPGGAPGGAGSYVPPVTMQATQGSY